MRKKNYVMRTKRANALRQKLLDTATELVMKEGYDNVSVGDICKKVGVTRGAFYGHFKSKDQIVLERIAVYDAEYRATILPQLADMKPGPDKILAYLQLVIKYNEEITRKLVRMSYIIRISRNGPPYIPNKREVYNVLEELVSEGQKAGEIRDDLSSAQLATVLFYSLVGLVFSWCVPGNQVDIAKTGKHMVEVLRPGLQKAEAK